LGRQRFLIISLAPKLYFVNGPLNLASAVLEETFSFTINEFP